MHLNYQISESRHYTDKLYLELLLLLMICLPTACYLVNLQARFGKVDD